MISSCDMPTGDGSFLRSSMINSFLKRNVYIFAAFALAKAAI